MTMTVKQLAGIFDDINNGKHKRVNQLNNSTWECNGLWIEKAWRGGGYYVLFCGDVKEFSTFGDAVEFCANH